MGRPAIEQAARADGKWVIETNDDTLTAEDAACVCEELERHRKVFPHAQADSTETFTCVSSAAAVY